MACVRSLLLSLTLFLFLSFSAFSLLFLSFFLQISLCLSFISNFLLFLCLCAFLACASASHFYICTSRPCILLHPQNIYKPYPPPAPVPSPPPPLPSSLKHRTQDSHRPFKPHSRGRTLATTALMATRSSRPLWEWPKASPPHRPTQLEWRGFPLHLALRSRQRGHGVVGIGWMTVCLRPRAAMQEAVLG